MRGRGRLPTTIPAQRRRPRRSRHLYAAPRTSLRCVCTGRRNCIEQSSPSQKYAPGTGHFPVWNPAIINRTSARWACLSPARHPRFHRRPPEAAFGGGMMGTARMQVAIENQQHCSGEKDGRHDDGESYFHAPNMPRGAVRFQPVALCRLSSKDRRRFPDGFPAEVIMGAGPGVDFGLADPAFEMAGMLVLMLLSRRGVIHAATGAGEFFGRPYAACHCATMRRRRADSSLRRFRS